MLIFAHFLLTLCDQVYDDTPTEENARRGFDKTAWVARYDASSGLIVDGRWSTAAGVIGTFTLERTTEEQMRNRASRPISRGGSTSPVSRNVSRDATSQLTACGTAQHMGSYDEPEPEPRCGEAVAQAPTSPYGAVHTAAHLHRMSWRQLHRRAEICGVHSTALAAVGGAADPREALAALILQREAEGVGAKPAPAALCGSLDSTRAHGSECHQRSFKELQSRLDAHASAHARAAAARLEAARLEAVRLEGAPRLEAIRLEAAGVAEEIARSAAAEVVRFEAARDEALKAASDPMLIDALIPTGLDGQPDPTVSIL